jgi:hypothetical protein
MNNPQDTYLEYSRRVGSLMGWLECELDRHEAEAMKPENARDWGFVGSMAHVEELLKTPLCFLSQMSEADIDEALNDGALDDE